MLCADAAVITGSPLVDKGLDGGEEIGVFGRRGDVQVEVSITLKYRWKEIRVSVNHLYTTITQKLGILYTNAQVFQNGD